MHSPIATCQNKLLDIREGGLDLPPDERHQFTRQLADYYASKPEHFAVVTDNPVETAFGMLFGSMLRGDNAKVFSSLEAALEWMENHHPA